MSARIEQYRVKVDARPGDTLARYVLAKEYHDKGVHDLAVEHFEILVASKPDWMKCYIHLGQSLASLGRAADARAALERALALARSQHHDGPAEEIAALLAGLD